jgi:hypothetical protein
VVQKTATKKHKKFSREGTKTQGLTGKAAVTRWLIKINTQVQKGSS